MEPGIIRTVAGVIKVDAARGSAQVDAIASFIDDVAKLGPEAGPLRGEVFKFGHAATEGALLRTLQGGTPVELLADTDVGVPRLARLSQAGAVVSPYGVGGAAGARGGVDPCMHSKLWTRGEHALLPTASAADAGSHQLNINIRFGGESARAAGRATEAAMSDSAAERRAGLDHARDHGVLYNDPYDGPDADVRYVDDAMFAAIDHSQRRLEVVTKEFTVPEWAERLADAQGRGVEVDVMTRMMTRDVRRILERAGVHESTVPFSNTPGLREMFGQRLHFNGVFADVPTKAELAGGASIDEAHAVIGTRYIWEPTRPGERTAREIAIALSGTNALDAKRAVDAHVGLNHAQVALAALRSGRGAAD